VLYIVTRDVNVVHETTYTWLPGSCNSNGRLICIRETQLHGNVFQM